ncbi:MAG: hypothetical protein E6G11_00970 [Actinobacteria bacterium]|nr:MAG: hypothetical protein E6G11_00970 [Actinomycetota bacterium]
MLERLAPAPGDTALELVAGRHRRLRGAALVAPGGRMIVNDFSEALVDTAERRVAEFGLGDLDFRILDGEISIPPGQRSRPVRSS